MSRLHPEDDAPGVQRRSFSFWERLKEIDRFFQGTDPVHQTMRRVVKRLEKADIPHAIMGGMAVNAHRYRRTTDDVDLLLTSEGLTQFRRLFVPKSYEQQSGHKRRFVDRANGVRLDVRVTGMFPGSGKPGPIAFPDPAQVSETINNIRVVDLATLVQLKLAAQRFRDLGDVVGLIRFNDLDEPFADRLHPSVRGAYIKCLEEKRREDEYEARED
jgi:hypothetical protein